MPYVLLIIGLLVTLVAAYKFLTRASRKQIATLIIIIGTLAISALVFILAITGRLPAIIGGIAAFWPLIYSVWQSHKNVRREEKIFSDISNSPINMTDAEAREVLGVSDTATEAEIEAAYKNLVKKLHPDSQGSAFLTKKVNVARDKLLKNKD